MLVRRQEPDKHSDTFILGCTLLQFYSQNILMIFLPSNSYIQNHKEEED